MWKITAKSESDAEILLYDLIGGYDENWEYQGAKNLIDKVRALGDVKNITLRINSIGGDVFEAQAMYSYLKSHPANVTVRVDGLAASAASLVAMAGDKVIMPVNALMMIHNPAGAVMGEAEELRDVADILDKVRETIATAYVNKTGMDREKVIAMMDDETWMSAEEAHELGFCDEVDGAMEIAAMAVQGGGLLCKAALGSARLSQSIASSLPKTFRKTIHPMEDENEMKIENVSDLEKEFPAFVDEIRNAATAAERGRLKALDDLSMPGGEEIVAKAKYEEPKDARDIAVELLHAVQNNAALTARFQDAGAVDPALGPQGEKQTKREEVVDLLSKNLNYMRGYH